MKKIDEGTKFRKSKSNRIAVTFDSISIIEIIESSGNVSPSGNKLRAVIVKFCGEATSVGITDTRLVCDSDKIDRRIQRQHQWITRAPVESLLTFAIVNFQGAFREFVSKHSKATKLILARTFFFKNLLHTKRSRIIPGHWPSRGGTPEVVS
jgi:hypothetical protein